LRGRRPPRGGEAAGATTPVAPKALAVRWLARRDYSRAELSQRLRQRGVAEEEVERALDELAAAGYLSDVRYAQSMVSQRSGRYGKRAIAHALRERGIAPADAAAALAPLAGIDELEQAQALWRQRFGAVPANEREKARQVRFLQARGFSLSNALRVLRAAGHRGSDDDA
jgi:regulatory protein